QFSFTVISEGGTDLSLLQADNAKKIEAVTDFVKKEGVDDKDIKTTAYSVSPRYTICYPYKEPSGVCPPREIVGYTVRQSTQVKIRDFDTIGDILGGVVTKGANSVSQLSFNIDDETILQAEAREEAIKKADQKAKEIAKAGGFRVGKVLGISEGYVSPYRTKYDYTYGMSAEFAESDSFAPTIEAGSQEVSVTVTLVYEIK
ncbi:MAG: SIMPL domain-containing protein, partial [Candidatus Pacebacteria bacterium]|nr:SIMPL domain-containing protein [Candidatus Paceibacterota bacterium]